MNGPVTDMDWQWCRELDLPWRCGSLREAKRFRRRLADALDALRDDARALLAEWNDQYPSAPLYLARSPDKSNTPVRWRWSREAGQRGRVELTDEEAMRHLERLDPADRAVYERFEWRRYNLAFALSTAMYRLARVDAWIEAEQAWRSRNDAAGVPRGA